MSCTLSEAELKKLNEVLDRFAEVTRAIVYGDVLETTGNDAWAQSEADAAADEVATVVEKLYKGLCPTRQEKKIIRSALTNFCTKDQKQLVKKIFPKLKMLWTSLDEDYICRL